MDWTSVIGYSAQFDMASDASVSILKWKRKLGNRTRVAFEWIFHIIITVIFGGRIRWQWLASAPHGRTQIVADIRLNQQFLEHFDDLDILLRRAFDVTALPFLDSNLFCHFTLHLAFVVRHIDFIANNHNRYTKTPGCNNLHDNENENEIYFELNVKHHVVLTSDAADARTRTCSRSRTTSAQVSASLTAYTRMNAPLVDIDSARMAGNWNAPDVSNMSSVSDAPSGSSYSPRCNSSTVCRYRVKYLSYKNCEIIDDFPTLAEPIITMRCSSLRFSRLSAGLCVWLRNAAVSDDRRKRWHDLGNIGNKLALLPFPLLSFSVDADAVDAVAVIVFVCGCICCSIRTLQSTCKLRMEKE